MIVYFECIKCEYKRLGLTNKKVAELFGITTQNLDYLIKKDEPRIHWLTYGLSSYYGK